MRHMQTMYCIFFHCRLKLANVSGIIGAFSPHNTSADNIEQQTFVLGGMSNFYVRLFNCSLLTIKIGVHIS